MRWTVVIPARALPDAKSRLLPASPDAAAHARLVRAIRADTAAAARAAGPVARVLLVVDVPGEPGEDETLVQTGTGLNAALVEGAELAAARWPEDGVAALLGDLPALRSDELGQALEDAATHPRSFVPDASGLGTTLLTARPGVLLRPAFGTGSAARHAVIATELAAGASLRQDVDTDADLHAAARLGLGPATGALVVHLDPA
jgi:2-phospho-L-lactate guanylyltransferase